MELYLIRHAQMQGDPHREYAPPVAGCLTEAGCAQASAVGRATRHIAFDAIYSSPLGRAVQTAQSVAGEDGPNITIAPWLIEWRPATVLGTCGESEYEHIAAAASLLRPEASWKTDAGEGTLEMAHRIIVGFHQMLARHGVRPGHGGYLLDSPDDRQRNALVGHGGSLGCLAAFLLGVPIKPFSPVAFSYTGTAVFQFVRRVDVWYPTLMLPPMSPQWDQL
jgi:broad specificity phosphatase PhoE